MNRPPVLTKHCWKEPGWYCSSPSNSPLSPPLSSPPLVLSLPCRPLRISSLGPVVSEGAFPLYFSRDEILWLQIPRPRETPFLKAIRYLAEVRGTRGTRWIECNVYVNSTKFGKSSPSSGVLVYISFTMSINLPLGPSETSERTGVS